MQFIIYYYLKKIYLKCNFSFLGANFEDFFVLYSLIYNYGHIFTRI